MLKSLRLKYHVNTIVIDQSLINNDLYEHKYLQKINKVYKHAGKCDNQQQFKYIIEAAMVCTPISPMISSPVKKPIARKSLCLFTSILDVKYKTATRLFGAAK